VPETRQSRALQRSAERRIWRTLLDYRDWVSFLYVPLLVPLLFVLPYYIGKWYHHSRVSQRLAQALAQSNLDYAVMSKLLLEGPAPPFESMPVGEARELVPPDYSGFEVIADTRILDLRPWKVTSGGAAEERSWGYLYRRMRVKKREPTADRFVLHMLSPSTRVDVRTLNDRVPTTVRLHRDAALQAGKQVNVYEIAFDLSKVPAGAVVDLPLEAMLREPRPKRLQSANCNVDADTGVLNIWVLLPEGKQLQSFDLLRTSAAKGSAPELITPASHMDTPDGDLLAFSLLSVKPGYTFECRWTHRE
jgi:hypothetical protein